MYKACESNMILGIVSITQYFVKSQPITPFNEISTSIYTTLVNFYLLNTLP